MKILKPISSSTLKHCLTIFLNRQSWSVLSFMQFCGASFCAQRTFLQAEVNVLLFSSGSLYWLVVNQAKAVQKHMLWKYASVYPINNSFSFCKGFCCHGDLRHLLLPTDSKLDNIFILMYIACACIFIRRRCVAMTANILFF